MKTIVIKFGGSSLATPEKLRRAAAMVLSARMSGLAPAAVVSAPADVTDDLLSLAARTAGDRRAAREADALMAAGEQISAALLAMAIEAEGGKAVSLTGTQAGMLTDATFSAAALRRVEPARVKKELRAGRIPVVAGFQGVSRAGDITTLGRGGSDLTAVALACALGAALCEFRTDVKGIYTAHPAIVPDARKIRELSYAEVLELARAGTEVRQLRAIALAARSGLPLHLRSSFHDEPGTMITARGGKTGISCLSLAREGGAALVTAIGRDLRREHARLALAAAGPGALLKRASALAVTLSLPPDSADEALRALHRAFFGRAR